MDTKRAYIDPEHPDPAVLHEAAALLRAGELVAFPTETVYGLGANALDAEACARIFEVKGRPQDNPLIVHVSRPKMVDEIIAHWTPAAEICARTFWPGPLTLVFPKNERIPDRVTAGLNTVAVRMPDHPVALALIEAGGLPLAAPSANLSGRPSPTTGSHVWEDMRGRIPLILDAGSCNVGLESTVLDVSGDVPLILRPGGLAKEDLEKVLGPVELDRPSVTGVPRAPGLKYRHYAPRGEMYVVVGPKDHVLDRMSEEIKIGRYQHKRIAILCTLESAPQLQLEQPDLLYVLGSRTQPQEVAASLFAGLRLCDQRGMELILAEGFDEGGLGLAIMNRLDKASGHKVIRV